MMRHSPERRRIVRNLVGWSYRHNGRRIRSRKSSKNEKESVPMPQVEERVEQRGGILKVRVSFVVFEYI